MKRNAIVVLGVFLAAGSTALGDEVLQFDVNGLSAEASGEFSESFTGNLVVFNFPGGGSGDIDGDAEILDLLIDGVNQNTGGASADHFNFLMQLEFVNGSITSGDIGIQVDENGDENTYLARVSPTNSGSILEIGPGEFIVGGLTFEGLFDNPAGTFLDVDITPWGSRQPVPGRFANIAFNPDDNFQDVDTDVDLFVLIPLPGAASLAGLGLLGLGVRRRR